jgi:tRNA-splicing ligase RtcB
VERLGPKLYSWASLLEDGTRQQAETTAAMPFVQPHLALMPDAHLGKGATVGSVIPTDGAIMPAAVGVDIGCGMQAVRTGFTLSDLRVRGFQELHASIARRVPLSAGALQPEGRGDRRAAGRAPDRAGRAGWIRPGAVRGQLDAAAWVARIRQPLRRGDRR